MKPLRLLSTATFSALLLAACATTYDPPPATWDGLELRQSSPHGALYLRPGLRAGPYRTVTLDPLVVAPGRNWMPVRNVRTGKVVERHPLSSEELRYIEDKIGAAFRDFFVEELTAGGYRIVDQPQADTLRVTCGLANVKIDTPSAGMGRLREDDSMTLVVDLYDASSGELIARVVDTKKGKLGMLEAPNTVVTNRAFRRAVEDWADRLRIALDAVNGPLSLRQDPAGMLARSREHAAAPVPGYGRYVD